MITQHVALTPVTEIIFALATTGTACLRLWLQRPALAERWRTLRLAKALRNVDSCDRAEVVQACADLEAAIGSGNHGPSRLRSQRPVLEPDLPAGPRPRRRRR
jgi:hypothetical protein